MSSINAQIRMASDDGEEVTSRYTPVKTTGDISQSSLKQPRQATSAWGSFKGFWMVNHNLRRHPFYPPGEPKRPENKSTKSFWSNFKGFWTAHHNLRWHHGRAAASHPFADRV